MVPGDLSYVPSPYKNLTYGKGFGVAARGLPTDPDPEQVIFYSIISKANGKTAISSVYEGSPVLSFYLRSFVFICTLETGQADVGNPVSCTLQLSGTAVGGRPVSTTCKYVASEPGTNATPGVCNVQGDFSAVTSVEFATVSPAVVEETLVTSFIQFDFLLNKAC